MRTRASVLGGLLLIAASLTGPIAPAGASDIVGYPRCDLDGLAADYTWWQDGVRIAVTIEPQLEWEGEVVAATPADCELAITCLIEWPDMAGRAATIVGTAGADHLIGTNGPDLIVGRAGDDHIEGRRGRDTICGGPGDDVIDGGRGDDRIFGRTGDDVLHGGTRFDLLHGGAGHDALFGDRGDDLLRGWTGRDSLYGGEGADDIRGGLARDVCFGGPDDDGFSSCGVAAPDEVTYGTGELRTFRVRVDGALDDSEPLTAARIDWILSDGRSWLGDGSVRWQRVGRDDAADLTIVLGAPATVDALCYPLKTGGYFSCRNGNTVAMNVNRWNGATDWWPASLFVYRTYLVNHEVGHFLGHRHKACPGPGEWADVMQQQTKRLDGCRANGWVYPEGAP